MSEPSRGPAAPGVRPRAVWSWCLYDWANSPFVTLITTFVFSAYFAQVVAANPNEGAASWGFAMGTAAIVIALLSPPLGAIADKAGARKPWLAALTLIIALGSAALWWAKPGAVTLSLVTVAVAVIAFEISMAFYNAMLPGIVRPSHLGRVSGWGWGIGYLGGLACLVLALVVFIQPAVAPFGLDKASYEHIRATNVVVAVWTVIFALPLFLFVPDQKPTGEPIGRVVSGGLKELVRTIREVRKYRDIVRFLVARLLFMEGINTVFLFGGIIAGTLFGMTQAEIILFGIALNVAAAAGAFGFGWMDDKVGSKPTMLLAVFAIAGFTAALLFVHSKTWFWILGLSISIFFGPVQAAARSMMARMAPPEKETEMFGLLALSGKAIAFLGPVMVSTVIALTGDQRLGMATLVPFMVAGGLILLTVKAPAQEPAARPAPAA
jgi:MFS transporter, UMF1 family